LVLTNVFHAAGPWAISHHTEPLVSSNGTIRYKASNGLLRSGSFQVVLLSMMLSNTIPLILLFVTVLSPLCFATHRSNSTRDSESVAGRAVSANYVFTVFTDASQSNLYVYTSPDATTWTLLAGPTYTPPTGLVRDPSVMMHTEYVFPIRIHEIVCMPKY
jgi:hypothetical protein